MSDDAPQTKPNPEPHKVRAGVMDAFLGNRGPHGELMRNGEPVLVRDLPDEDDEDEA